MADIFFSLSMVEWFMSMMLFKYALKSASYLLSGFKHLNLN